MSAKQDQSKNGLERLQKWLLDKKPIAVIVLIVILAYAFVKYFLDVKKLYDVLTVPDIHYAIDIADEYYVWIKDFNTPCEAKNYREKLEKLTNEVLDFQVNMDSSILKYTDEKSLYKEYKSRSLGLGFFMDQIVYCRSDKDDEIWIVGLDLEKDQGEYVTTKAKRKEIISHLDSLIGNVILNEPDLMRRVDSIYKDFEISKTKFFDAVRFKELHGYPITK